MKKVYYILDDEHDMKLNFCVSEKGLEKIKDMIEDIELWDDEDE